MLNTWRRVRTRSANTGAMAAAAMEVARRQAAEGGYKALRVGRAVAAGAAAAAGVGAAVNAARAVKSRSVAYVPGSMGGKVRLNLKRKRRISKYKVRVARPIRKYVNRRIKQETFEKLSDIRQTKMGQWTSAVNKVAYYEDFTLGRSEVLLYAIRTKMENTAFATTDVVVEDLKDVALTQLGNCTVKLLGSVKYIIRNNSTSPAHLIAYHMKCIDQTDVTPTADLDSRLSQQRGTYNLGALAAAGAPIAKEDQFQQFWSTPIMKECHWKIKQKHDFLLAAGDEIQVYFDINVPCNTKYNAIAYQKGSEVIMFRLQGRPSHDSTTSSLLGIADTLVDFQRQTTFTSYKKGASSSLSTHVDVGNSGFSAITPIIAGDAMAGVVEE